MTHPPERVSSGSPYEDRIGFSRAVRRGPHIWVAGTGPLLPSGDTACPGDAYGQAKRCLAIIMDALQAVGAGPADVVRTRLLMTDISRWEEATRAHAEMFAAARPAATLMGVQALARDDWIIEIEADAFIAPGPAS